MIQSLRHVLGVVVSAICTARLVNGRYQMNGELIWYDEFIGDSIDTDKWSLNTGDGCDVDLCDWGNSELEWYRKENAAVKEGQLYITAKQEEYGGKSYTSARMSTKLRADFLYGRVEARIQLPGATAGLWPAFWMMPTDNVYGVWAASGEIDIMETIGNMTSVQHNLAYGQAYPKQTLASSYGDKCKGSYTDAWALEPHTFAVEWSENVFRWYIDEELTCEKTQWQTVNSFTGEKLAAPAPFDQAFHIILDMAIGGVYAGKDIGDVDNEQMIVDWVRVYQDSADKEKWTVPASIYKAKAVGTGLKEGVQVWPPVASTTSTTGTSTSTATLLDTLGIIEGTYCDDVSTWCTHEVQSYLASNVAYDSESGGLTLSVTNGGDSATPKYVSGMVHSSAQMNFQNGRIEAVMNLPKDTAGITSSIWLTPVANDDQTSTNMPRIYVMASSGDRVIGRVSSRTSTSAEINAVGCAYEGTGLTGSDITYTSTTSSSPSAGETEAATTTLEGYYQFALEWQKGTGRLRWYINNVQYCEAVVDTAIFEQPMYFSINVAVGRDEYGNQKDVSPLTANSYPLNLNIAHIRVLQLQDWLPVTDSPYLTHGYLIWNDEFDNSNWPVQGELSTVWWTHHEGDGCPENCGNGNLEAQIYSKQNVQVADGNLLITARQEVMAGHVYSSAKISTFGTASFYPGRRFDIRAKLPKGQGLWPAIWLMPVDPKYGKWAASGEIDILENRNQMEKHIGQLHFGAEWPNDDTLNLYHGGFCYNEDVLDFSADYHIYSLEWEKDVFRWYVDGRKFCERSYWYSASGQQPVPFDQPFHLIMNLAVGGTFTGGPIMADNLFPASLVVDYVRVYSMDPYDIIRYNYTAPPVGDSDDGSNGSGGGGGGSGVGVNTNTLAIALGTIGGVIVLALVYNKGKKYMMRRRAADLVSHSAVSARAAGADGAGGGSGIALKAYMDDDEDEFSSQGTGHRSPPSATV